MAINIQAAAPSAIGLAPNVRNLAKWVSSPIAASAMQSKNWSAVPIDIFQASDIKPQLLIPTINKKPNTNHGTIMR